MSSTALAHHQSVLPAVFEAGETEEQIRPFLPVGVSYARVVAAAQLAAMKTPALHQCTSESIIMSIAKILQWGLEIGTTAHLVPFGRECTAIADYKGLAELMIESGAVRYVDARCVYANEFFEQVQGSDARLTHQPISDAAGRGALIGAYCVLRLPFGLHVFEFMPIADIDAIRTKHSKQWKSGACPGWYAKKTVVRQISKLIPKGRKAGSVLRVIEEEAQQEFGALDAGDAEDEVVAPALRLAETEKPLTLERTMSLEDALAFTIPRGKMKGQSVSELTVQQLTAALLWTVDNDTEPEFQLALATVLDAQEKEPAPDAGAPQDSPVRNDVTSSPAPVAAPPLTPGQTYVGDPYPENDPERMSAAQLQATALALLKHPSMGAEFVAGMHSQIHAGLTHVQLQTSVRELRAMIASAPPPRRKGERRPHSLGVLPDGV